MLSPIKVIHELCNLNILSTAIQYGDTADYYWPLISDPLVGGEDPTSFVNADGKTSATDIVAGPFGFGDANVLDNNRVS